MDTKLTNVTGQYNRINSAFSSQKSRISELNQELGLKQENIENFNHKIEDLHAAKRELEELKRFHQDIQATNEEMRQEQLNQPEDFAAELLRNGKSLGHDEFVDLPPPITSPPSISDRSGFDTCPRTGSLGIDTRALAVRYWEAFPLLLSSGGKLMTAVAWALLPLVVAWKLAWMPGPQ